MRTSSRSGILSPVGRSSLYYTAAPERESHTQTISGESGKYDSITLSTNTDGASSFKDLVGRLTQEVRTATTTGDIRALHREVSSGTYQPNASAIAARMLFIREDL